MPDVPTLRLYMNQNHGNQNYSQETPNGTRPISPLSYSWAFIITAPRCFNEHFLFSRYLYACKSEIYIK